MMHLTYLYIGLAVAVVLEITVVAPQTVRLTKGLNPWEGFLEVFHNGQWGTVCDDHWTSTNTEVACRQLGYFSATAPTSIVGGRKYGLPIWLDEVVCTSSDQRIEDCSHNEWGQSDCGDENIQLMCQPVCQQHSGACLNGGQCVDVSSLTYRCDCPSTAIGQHCEADVDECLLDNGGCSHSCLNLNFTGHTCECPHPELQLAPDGKNCYSPYAGVTCSSQGMSVSLDKSGLAGVRAEHLRLDGSGCPALDTPSHIALNIPLNQCGTARYADGDDWVYENHITSQQQTVTGQQLVSHVRKLNVTVRCRYPQTVHVHRAFHVHSEQLSFVQNKEGRFPLQLDLEVGGHVYHPGGAALVVDPGTPLSVHLFLEDSHPELEVLTDNCVATPTFNVTAAPAHYSILQNGCAMDTTLQQHRNGSEELLSFQAFKFVGQSSTVFLHCDVIVCNTSDTASRCQEGCLLPSNSGAKRQSEPMTFLERRRLSFGPLLSSETRQESEEDSLLTDEVNGARHF